MAIVLAACSATSIRSGTAHSDDATAVLEPALRIRFDASSGLLWTSRERQLAWFARNHAIAPGLTSKTEAGALQTLLFIPRLEDGFPTAMALYTTDLPHTTESPFRGRISDIWGTRRGRVTATDTVSPRASFIRELRKPLPFWERGVRHLLQPAGEPLP